MSYVDFITGHLVESILLDALSYINEASWPDAIRLFKTMYDSGADDSTSLSALFRWTRGRKHYEAIHSGLKNFFNGEALKWTR